MARLNLNSCLWGIQRCAVIALFASAPTAPIVLRNLSLRKVLCVLFPEIRWWRNTVIALWVFELFVVIVGLG